MSSISSLLKSTFIVWMNLLFFTLISFSQNSNTPINWNSFMLDQQLKWDTVSTNYYTGILLGNGRLGTNIYKENDNAIRFDIGRSDVTDQRPHYPDSVANEQLLSRPRLPIGKMLLKTKGRIVSADMKLDIYNAESNGTIHTTAGTIHFYAVVPTGEEVVVIKVFGTGEEKNTHWEWIAEESVSPRISSESKKMGKVTYLPNPLAQQKDSAGYHLCHQPLLYSDGYCSAWKEVNTADTNTLIIAVGYSPDFTSDATKEAIYFIQHYFAKKEAAVIAQHRSWWHQYTRESFISIPDARMQNYYYMEQYNMAAATREGKPMVDLMGPWFKSKTPWPGIWWNLNTQLAYSAVFTSNHLDIGRSLFDAVYNNRNSLIKNVPKEWQFDAAALGRISSYDLVSPVLKNEIDNGKFEPGNLTWTMYYYYKYFLYSKDTAELKTRIFPLLKRSVNFLLHLLTKDNEGVYHIINSFSPEYTTAVDAHYSLSALKWGLSTLLSTDQLLGTKEADRNKWENILAHLSPYHTNTNGYLIGKDKPLLNSHRHFSHLMMIYPYRTVSFSDSVSLALVNKSINYWESMNKKFRGYSYVAASSMASLMNNGNLAFRYLDSFLLRHGEANGLYGEAGPCFETPHGMTNSLLEMLLQSQEPLIRIFPAIPDNWQDASFADLRAEGAFLVSANRKKMQTALVVIKSEKGGGTTIETDIPSASILIKSDKGKCSYRMATVNNKTLITLITSPGEKIAIRNKKFPEALIQPVKTTTYHQQYWGLQKSTPENEMKKAPR